MPSFALDGLVSEFKDKVGLLISQCQAIGYELRPIEGLRDPFKQAKYWRQSRTWETVQGKIRELKQQKADYLAYCIEVVGPQYGKVGNHVTHAIPGYSFHQWGEALDCMWVVNQKAEYSIKIKVNGDNGYKVYVREAEKLGLVAGGKWTDFKDWPHVQLRPGTPHHLHSLLEIDSVMRERFGFL